MVINNSTIIALLTQRTSCLNDLFRVCSSRKVSDGQAPTAVGHDLRGHIKLYCGDAYPVDVPSYFILY